MIFMAEKKEKGGFVVEFLREYLEFLNELAYLDGRSRKKYVEGIVLRHIKKIKSVKNDK